MNNDNRIYQKVFEHAKEGFILTGSEGIIELVNPKLLEIFGYEKKEDLVGMRIDLLVPAELRKTHEKHRSNYMKKPVDRTMGVGRVLKGLRKDGSEFAIEISLSHFKDDSGDTKVIGFVVDVSYRKQMEDLLLQLNTELEDKVKERTLELEVALEKGKALNELKTRFVSIVSHEFRTPLSSIFSSATLISKYTKSNQQENRDKHIDRIKSSVNNLIAILNDILTINRVEEGMFPVNLELLNIEKISHEVCEELQALATRGQVINYGHKGEEIFKSDKKLLLTVLNNVISNAVKYSMPNGIVNISTEVNKNGVLIKVIDYGIGIPFAEQEKLFQRFYRAANVANIEGTGLGLSIVKKYVELLNGTVEFESEPQVKTEFKIHLPHYD